MQNVNIIFDNLDLYLNLCWVCLGFKYIEKRGIEQNVKSHHKRKLNSAIFMNARSPFLVKVGSAEEENKKRETVQSDSGPK